PRYARVVCAVAAAAAGVDALDTVYTDIADLAGLRRECEDAVAMGFTGKISIHPNQVPVINDVFTPAKEALEEARELVAAFEEHARRGVYAFTFRGRMVDAPHLARARKLLARAGSGATRFEAGARVGLAWLRRTCGACAYCASGRENLCERAEFTGYYADGGFADYAVAPAAFAYRIPAAFSDADAAPLLCACIIGYRALKRSETPPGGRLGIYGFGSSAHVTLQVARARGCEVFVCTREASHRDLARRLGAAWAGDLRDSMPVKT